MSIKNIDKEEVVVIRTTKHKGYIYANERWFTVNRDEVSMMSFFGELLVREELDGESKRHMLKVFNEPGLGNNAAASVDLRANTSRL